jgi:hypothetical protein
VGRNPASACGAVRPAARRLRRNHAAKLNPKTPTTQPSRGTHRECVGAVLRARYPCSNLRWKDSRCSPRATAARSFITDAISRSARACRTMAEGKQLCCLGQ